ncbi:MAG: hypothetical protein ABIG84_04950 [archaeon]
MKIEIFREEEATYIPIGVYETIRGDSSNNDETKFLEIYANGGMSRLSLEKVIIDLERRNMMHTIAKTNGEDKSTFPDFYNGNGTELTDYEPIGYKRIAFDGISDYVGNTISKMEKKAEKEKIIKSTKQDTKDIKYMISFSGEAS